MTDSEQTAQAKVIEIYSPKTGESSAFEKEPKLRERIEGCKVAFQTEFDRTEDPEVVVRSPGRAEIIGNHTDYNDGFAISAALSANSILTLMSKREDRKVVVVSEGYGRIEIDLDDIVKFQGESQLWGNYLVSVLVHLIQEGELKLTQGADIYIDSNIPTAGGVSTSAALELGFAVGLLSLNDHPIERLRLAQICKSAENDEYFVNSPCGFLDQGAIALAQSNEFTFLDFHQKPVEFVEQLPAEFEADGYSFVITIDPTVSRGASLGESGYPARRKDCEAGLRLVNDIFNEGFTSLRDITPQIWNQSIDGGKSMRDSLYELNPLLAKRLDHVILENLRVVQLNHVLHRFDRYGSNDDFDKLYVDIGKLLTLSGISAIELYDLAQGTPELVELLTWQRKLDYVLGTRNMGGGFSGITLSLVRTADLKRFKRDVFARYSYGERLQFVDFTPGPGVELLEKR